MTRPRVVIVGAGFGGLECAKKLAGRPVDVTLLDRNNYHVFTPLLYQVATSLLNPSDIAHPVRGILRGGANIHFQLAEVVSVDLDAQSVRSKDGAVFPYDYLVLATGSGTNFFGLESVERVAYGLKDIPEALALRNHVIRCFESAAREPDQVIRDQWLRFAVVGGGPTGVEYAGALAELVRGVLVRDYPDLDLKRVRIVLIEALDRLLAAFPEPLGRYAERRLVRMGVEVRLNTRVVEAREDAIVLPGGDIIPARTLVWAAGVKPPPPIAVPTPATTRGGRIPVDDRLRVGGRATAFAIGDIAAATQNGREIAMLSAPAIQEGRFVARAILAAQRNEPPRPFRYFDKGIMATIGRNAAVAKIGPLALKGFVGWFFWLFVHLFFLIGFRNRIAVLLGWAWNYLFYDRPIRLIARAKPTDSIG